MGCAASTPVLEQKKIGRDTSIPEQGPVRGDRIDASDSAVSEWAADEYSSITGSGASDDEGDNNSVKNKKNSKCVKLFVADDASESVTADSGDGDEAAIVREVKNQSKKTDVVAVDVAAAADEAAVTEKTPHIDTSSRNRAIDSKKSTTKPVADASSEKESNSNTLDEADGAESQRPLVNESITISRSASESETAIFTLGDGEQTPASGEEGAASSKLPDWLATPTERKGIFGIAGSVARQSKLDASGLHTSQSSRVSERSIQSLKDPKKRLSQKGVLDEKDGTEESNEYAKHLKVKALSGQDRKAEFFDLLNLDAWRSGGKKLDEEKIVEIIREYPQHCGEMYNFDKFHGIFPLSVLCALGASVSTIKACFHAYKDAIMESDALVGTSVHYACAYKASLDVVKYLVNKEPGALREVNQFERMPLHMACLFGASSSVICFLVEQYPDACKKIDRDGMAPLHLLCDSDVDVNPSDVELLLEEEPVVCLIQTKEDGSTPLHLAVAEKATLSVLKALIKANDAALSVKDAKGRIPLFVAVAIQADIETFKLLVLKYPAGRTTKNKLNELPVTMAARMKLNTDLLDLLKPL